MVAFNKFNSFSEALAEKVHNLGSDAIKVALCAAANAPVAGNSQLSNLTEISYANVSSRAVTTSTSAQTGGTYKLVLTDLVLSATGAVGPFRYVVLYNDTATNKELIGYLDYGSDLSMVNGNSFTIDFDGSAGVLTLA
ncbi:hypothetical protein X747_14785 [Mesorhizobium sp. LNJC384A00]|uniref:hypothetical protein n=1 Tax=unclassified Mesorhizobium TaxID=325217 RepID=UPI0003CF15F7|nr:hypothetical protein [Mesorhizobium sp. LNJC384A00]ESY42043.1 hypothetical protein X747_14785 [Mesorhizobium sp. LNJC384A00]